MFMIDYAQKTPKTMFGSHKNLITKLDYKKTPKRFQNRKRIKSKETPKCKLLKRVRYDAHQVQIVLFLAIKKFCPSFQMR